MLTEQEQIKVFERGFMDKLAGIETALAELPAVASEVGPSALSRIYKYLQPEPVSARSMAKALRNVVLAPVKYPLQGMGGAGNMMSRLKLRLGGVGGEEAAGLVESVNRDKMVDTLNSGMLRSGLNKSIYRHIYDIPEEQIQSAAAEAGDRRVAEKLLSFNGIAPDQARRDIQQAALLRDVQRIIGREHI